MGNTSSCTECGSSFTTADMALNFWQARRVPPPRLCPDCRLQRRLMYRNERNFCRRSCDRCRQSIISMYSADKPFPVYCAACWWSDGWSALSELEFDFSRPFFPQFCELRDRTPRPALFNQKSENCIYSNHSEGNKNCYLTITTFNSEDILYGRKVYNCSACLDCHWIKDCSLCYEVWRGENCYECLFGSDLQGCSRCCFAANCVGCSNCILCTNLTHKQNYLRNTPASPDLIAAERAKLSSQRGLTALRADWDSLRAAMYVKHLTCLNTEQCRGDYLVNCKNIQSGFYLNQVEDASDVYEGSYARDVHSAYGFGAKDTECCGEATAILGAYDVCFASLVYDSSAVWYSDLCFNAQDLFGCVGLNRERCCILNRRYPPDEYARRRVQIIDHMRASGEFGRFFPPEKAPFGYNESCAQEYFPLSEQEAGARGWPWHVHEEKPPQAEGVPAAGELPDALSDISDEVLQIAVICEVSGRPFRIQPTELALYRQLGVAPPRVHFDARFQRRLQLRNPRCLREAHCAGCGAELLTSYPEDGGPRVLCEGCYQS